MNYTKGKWQVIQPEVEPQRFIIQSILPNKDGFGNTCIRTICRTQGYCFSKAEELANAYLIAATPKLHRASKRFFNPDGTYNLHPANFDQLKEALTEVEGVVATTEEGK